MKKFRLIKLLLGAALIGLLFPTMQSCRRTGCYIPVNNSGNNNVRTLSNDNDPDKASEKEQDKMTVSQDSTFAE